ncbi:MAG: molybdopterin cofactor-binding domain-containing protein, partial [Candidatus Bipolaricaulia bacterium]
MTVHVNGRPFDPAHPPERTLLDWLRKDLGLTGAKDGCDGKGTCGACTVIMDGRAVRSCQVKLADLKDGTRIETIEGLGDKVLHPLQEAFVKSGAVQCGFCTPGMIMAAKALLDQTPTPTRAEIRRALRGNLCRCTGYVKILEAVERASQVLRGEARPEVSEDVAVHPYAADDKVTGRLQFIADLPTDGVLEGKIVWAEHAHAEIRKVDTEKAQQVPGVVAVLTARDIPGEPCHGLIRADQPVLCDRRVRYLGDAVALVVATSEEAAIQGRAAVEVEYAPLPTVTDPEQALADDAPTLSSGGNLVCEFHLDRGSAEEAIAESAICVSGEFTTQAIEHAYLEPEAGIASWEDGRVVVRTASQYPHAMRRQIARVLGQPEDRVRVVASPTGGAFGGKTDISIQALLALATWRTHRSVRIVLTREESLRTSVKRHPMRLAYRIGFDAGGRITGLKADILADCGAYDTLSDPLLEQTTAFSAGPYRVPHVSVHVRGVLTNAPPSSAMRGFGIPQAAFAVESLVDEAAEKLGLSPIEIRRRNALRPGDTSATGQRMGQDTHLAEALDLLEKEYEREVRTLRPGGGVGVACGYKNVGLGLGEHDFAEVTLEASRSGNVVVRSGAIDLGQGVSTVLAEMTAREMGVPYECIRVESGDTDLCPDARETNASRQTVMSGNALLLAVAELQRKAVEIARRRRAHLKMPLAFIDGRVVDAEGSAIGLAELASDAEGGCLRVVGSYTAPVTVPLDACVTGAALTHYFAYTFFANLAVVHVEENGEVTVERIVASYD